jgi:hypothetical protein
VSVPYTSARLTITSMSNRRWRRIAMPAEIGISGRVHTPKAWPSSSRLAGRGGGEHRHRQDHPRHLLAFDARGAQEPQEYADGGHREHPHEADDAEGEDGRGNVCDRSRQQRRRKDVAVDELSIEVVLEHPADDTYNAECNRDPCSDGPAARQQPTAGEQQEAQDEEGKARVPQVHAQRSDECRGRPRARAARPRPPVAARGERDRRHGGEAEEQPADGVVGPPQGDEGTHHEERHRDREGEEDVVLRR